MAQSKLAGIELTAERFTVTPISHYGKRGVRFSVIDRVTGAGYTVLKQEEPELYEELDKLRQLRPPKKPRHKAAAAAPAQPAPKPPAE